MIRTCDVSDQVTGSMNKKKVLFVGSFLREATDGSLGGQMFACQSLVNSALTKDVVWTFIDSTSASNIIAGFFNRAIKALFRLLVFNKNIIFSDFDVILIFTADGLSFIEKGLMAILAKCFTRSKIIIAPRSGFIINDIKNNRYLREFIKIVFSKVDIIICQSESWRKLFIDLTKRRFDAKFEIIENWLNADDYFNIPQKIFQSSGPVKILFMSWLDRNKGVYELVEAAKILQEEGFDFEINLAGHGADFYKILDLVKRENLENRVKLLGWIVGEHKIKILAETDIYVLPSYFEGYPNSLLEAMAAGKACIASRVGGIPDIIQDQTNGFLIDSHNTLQMVEKIKLLIADPDSIKKMGEEARKSIYLRNTEAVAISKFIDLMG